MLDNLLKLADYHPPKDANFGLSAWLRAGPLLAAERPCVLRLQRRSSGILLRHFCNIVGPTLRPFRGLLNGGCNFIATMDS